MTRGEMLKSDSDHLDRLPGDGDIQAQLPRGTKKVCIVGASGKLGQYMVQHALDRGAKWLGSAGRKVSPSSTPSRDASLSSLGQPTTAK